MTNGTPLYYISPAYRLQEYTYIQMLPMLETAFNKSLEEDEKITFEQHLIADADGNYELINTDELGVRYFLTKEEAIQAKADEITKLLAQLT